MMGVVKLSDFRRISLEQEYDQLKDKLEKLIFFVESDKFKDIELYQQTILNIQLSSMETYLKCLEARKI